MKAAPGLIFPYFSSSFRPPPLPKTTPHAGPRLAASRRRNPDSSPKTKCHASPLQTHLRRSCILKVIGIFKDCPILWRVELLHHKDQIHAGYFDLHTCSMPSLLSPHHKLKVTRRLDPTPLAFEKVKNEKNV